MYLNHLRIKNKYPSDSDQVLREEAELVQGGHRGDQRRPADSDQVLREEAELVQGRRRRASDEKLNWFKDDAEEPPTRS